MYKFTSKHHYMWIKTIELHNDSTKVWPVPRPVLQGEVCQLAEVSNLSYFQFFHLLTNINNQASALTCQLIYSQAVGIVKGK